MDNVTNLNRYHTDKLTKEIVESIRDMALAMTETEFAIRKLSIILSETEFAADCAKHSIEPEVIYSEAVDARVRYRTARKSFGEVSK